MKPWIVTKRRDRDYLVHRDGELRGICTTWEQDHANRIAAALNTAPFPGTQAESIDNVLLAGGILAETTRRTLTEAFDIPITHLVQITNALTYWDMCIKKTNKENQNG
jgi:hypothetical protein